ncbi:hypothetical protein [Psychromonas sp. Urea-02u-13]|uniref:hypothetical protein n=1 Tax=Psychromonas sp. Urea-02u-13 TaxID=2058326 RepID=UPI000C32C08A|nr:hypothetical protein [Psychromonas sp. Urea-02u-13]PKG38318.1 hypothetical protein CXF74_14475 [Psychromonas sp. Urea-02u-13]
MKIILAMFGIQFLIVLVTALSKIAAGSSESRDNKRISVITSEIEKIQRQDLFGDDKSEKSQRRRNARKIRLFAERELLFSKYND